MMSTERYWEAQVQRRIAELQAKKATEGLTWAEHLDELALWHDLEEMSLYDRYTPMWGGATI